MGLVLRDTTRHTCGDYLTWPEDVRHELIDGIAYLMAPAPTPRHQHFVGGYLVPDRKFSNPSSSKGSSHSCGAEEWTAEGSSVAGSTEMQV